MLILVNWVKSLEKLNLAFTKNLHYFEIIEKNIFFQKIRKHKKLFIFFSIFCYFLQIAYMFASKLFQSSIFSIRSRIYSYYLSILNETSGNFFSLSSFIDFFWNIIELEVPEITMLVYSLDLHLSRKLFVQRN